MAKTNKKSQINTIDRKRNSSEPSKPTATALRPSGPTQRQIADRAKQIWRQKGCPAGQDESNWYEAETQLKREFAVR